MNPVDEARIRRLKEQRQKQKLSAVFEMPDLKEPGQVVSKAEMEFFKDYGFLIKQGLLDPARLAPAMDEIWSHLLENVPLQEESAWPLSRDDKETWINPEWGPMLPVPTSGPYQGRQPIQYMGRNVKMHDIGDADYLLELLPGNPGVRAVAGVLLGENLRSSIRTRGVYAVFPSQDPTDPSGVKQLCGSSLVPHTDAVCQQLNVCAYLEDVLPRNGGFTVYPSSHKIMFQAHKYEANWSPLPTFADAVSKVVAKIEPVELIGDKGTVIFWHGRTLHSSGIHIGSDIRWAVFADYTHNREVISDEEHRQLGQFEWFKDTKLFKEDWEVRSDMWRNWNLGRSGSE